MSRLARLDKTGLRVLCWWPRCPGELAQISEWGGATFLPTADGGHVPLLTGRTKRTVSLGPGLRQDDRGRWVYTEYARTRMEHGSGAAFRRPIRRQLDRKLGRARTARVTLPAEVECPRCGAFSVLDAEVLRVSHSA